MADNKFDRKVAEKIKIVDLVNGEFVKSPGEFEPSYVNVGNKAVGRVNIMGIVVAVSELGDSFSLDDSTGIIEVRSFDNESSVEVIVGELVNIIGKPREFNNQIFIVREIVKKVGAKWLELRKKELASKSFVKSEEKTVKEETVEKVEPKEEKKETIIEAELTPPAKILKIIKDSDGGEGADFEEIVEKSGLDGAEEIINRLLEEGELFEVKSGRLKILE